VVEIGAGKGRITHQLASSAAKVIAIENDPRLAGLLVDRFSKEPNVIVVAGDALAFPMPAEPFRVVGNIPFGISSALFRYLLDGPVTALYAADLIVQWGAALKRTRAQPSNMQNIKWGPWWSSRVTERVPSTAFDPRPSVDAAVLGVRKRKDPLLPRDQAEGFRRMVSIAFAGNRPLVRSLGPGYSTRRVTEACAATGVPCGSLATQVTLEDWVSLFTRLHPGAV